MRQPTTLEDPKGCDGWYFRGRSDRSDLNTRTGSDARDAEALRGATRWRHDVCVTMTKTQLRVGTAVVLMMLAVPAVISAQWRRDTTPPTVTVTAPVTGATVRGVVTLSASATDNVRVAGVQFQVDGVNVGSEDAYAPYTVAWNSAAVADGTHAVSATARDSSGNRKTAGVSVVVANATGPDVTAPSISIRTPTTAATYSATATPLAVNGVAADNVGVTAVTWATDRGASGTATGTTSWSLSVPLQGGANVLTATARDAAGNTRSATLTVTYTAPLPWTLVFSDEFDGTLLDRTIWGTTYPDGSRTNNNELEWYMDGDEYHVVSNGTLKLVATTQVSEPGYPYSSGMVTTYSSFNQMYGKFEARMKLPKGQGLWPAFWLLPVPLMWPPEIDIMENLGQAPSTIYFTNHWATMFPDGDPTGANHGGQKGGSYSGAIDFSADFHVFAVEWDSAKIVWLIDGVERGRVTQYVPTAGHNFTGFYILLNLAVGGSWPGAPNSATVFPSALEIDYVRVYRR